MLEYETNHKEQETSKYEIISMGIDLKGKILYVTSSENNIMFILTDSEEYNFYVIKYIKKGRNKEKYIENYFLKSEIPEGALFQTNNQESQIWCDKLGTHVIIKYKNAVFYYNPYMKKKTAEMMLFTFNKYLQPYSVAFNDDFYDIEKTGKILFSDYNSYIYELEIELNEQKEMMHFFGEIFKFKKEKVKKYDETYEDPDFDFFQMERDDRILDMKIIISKDTATMGDESFRFSNIEGKNIFILAITKNILFQFYGKDSFKQVFDNYKLEDENILRAYKRFISRTNNELRYSRIQFINDGSLGRDKYLFSFMSELIYIIGKLSKINPEPQKRFKIIELIEGFPKVVCQSFQSIFFLYHNYLVILNKLTNRIIKIQKLSFPYLDMYYNQISNGIIIYNENGIYKIPIEDEFKYIYEDYIEIGNYKAALQLTNEQSKLRPILHKLYAEQLFEQKLYLKAADEYAFSDEIFEHVCVKFLSIENYEGLLQYLALVLYFRCKNKKNSSKNKSETERKDNYFIDKCLITTWIIELIFAKNENNKDSKLIKFLRACNEDHKIKDHLIVYMMYYLLNFFNKNKIILKLEDLGNDYKRTNLYFHQQREIEECLSTLSILIVIYGTAIENPVFKEKFLYYTSIYIKVCPKEYNNLLKNYFVLNDGQEGKRKISRTLNYKMYKDEENFKLVLNFIKSFIIKEFKILGGEINFAGIATINILLSSFKNKLFNEEIIDYLMKYLISNSIKLHKMISSVTIYYDLQLAKQILEKKSDVIYKKILCILYYFLEKYIDSIDIAIRNNLKFKNKEQYAIILAENLPDPNLRKMWVEFIEGNNENKNFWEMKDKLFKFNSY